MGNRIHPGGDTDYDRVIAEALAEVGLPPPSSPRPTRDDFDDELRAHPPRGHGRGRDGRRHPGDPRARRRTAPPSRSSARWSPRAPQGEAAGRLWDGTLLVAGTPGLLRDQAHPHAAARSSTDPEDVAPARLARSAPCAFTSGADHAGFELKGLLVEHLRSAGHDVVDHGADDVRRPRRLPAVLRRGGAGRRRRPRQPRGRDRRLRQRRADRGQQGARRAGRAGLVDRDRRARPAAQRRQRGVDRRPPARRGRRARVRRRLPRHAVQRRRAPRSAGSTCSRRTRPPARSR